jgi:disulfide bond formation protein DsbB
MRVFLKKGSPNQTEFGILYGGIAVMPLLAAWTMPAAVLLPSCAFQGLFGIPCPTCGATRSIMHLANGSIAAALAMNPLIAVSIVSAILYFLYSLISITAGVPRVHITLTDAEKNVLRIGAVLIVLINWAYLIVSR